MGHKVRPRKISQATWLIDRYSVVFRGTMFGIENLNAKKQNIGFCMTLIKIQNRLLCHVSDRTPNMVRLRCIEKRGRTQLLVAGSVAFQTMFWFAIWRVTDRTWNWAQHQFLNVLDICLLFFWPPKRGQQSQNGFFLFDQQRVWKRTPAPHGFEKFFAKLEKDPLVKSFGGFGMGSDDRRSNDVGKQCWLQPFLDGSRFSHEASRIQG